MHVLLKLMEHEIATNGKSIMIVSNIASSKLVEVGNNVENVYLEEDFAASLIEAGGLSVKTKEELDQKRMYRPKDDTLLALDEMNLWNVGKTMTVVFVENRWVGKIIEIAKESDGGLEITVSTINGKPEQQQDVFQPNDDYDRCMDLLVQSGFFKPQNHEASTSIYFNLLAPPQGRNNVSPSLMSLHTLAKHAGIMKTNQDMNQDVFLCMQYNLLDCLMNIGQYKFQISHLTNKPSKPKMKSERWKHKECCDVMVSVRNPHASLIISGEKKIENRKWPIGNYKGKWIALQIGKELDKMVNVDEDLSLCPEGHIVGMRFVSDFYRQLRVICFRKSTIRRH